MTVTELRMEAKTPEERILILEQHVLDQGARISQLEERLAELLQAGYAGGSRQGGINLGGPRATVSNACAPTRYAAPSMAPAAVPHAAPTEKLLSQRSVEFESRPEGERRAAEGNGVRGNSAIKAAMNGGGTAANPGMSQSLLQITDSYEQFMRMTEAMQAAPMRETLAEEAGWGSGATAAPHAMHEHEYAPSYAAPNPGLVHQHSMPQAQQPPTQPCTQQRPRTEETASHRRVPSRPDERQLPRRIPGSPTISGDTRRRPSSPPVDSSLASRGVHAGSIRPTSRPGSGSNANAGLLTRGAADATHDSMSRPGSGDGYNAVLRTCSNNAAWDTPPSSRGNSTNTTTSRANGGGGRPPTRTLPRSTGRRAETPPPRAAPPKLRRISLLEGPTEKQVSGIVVSDDGGDVVCGGHDGELQLWSRGDAGGLGTTMRSGQTWERCSSQTVGGGEINALALLGTTLACACQDGSVPLFRLYKEGGSSMLYSLLRLHHPPRPGGGNGGREVMCLALSAVCASKNAPLLASGTQDGGVSLWNCMSGQLLQRLETAPGEPAHANWVMCMVLDKWPDEQREGLLITGAYDHRIKVWAQSSSGSGRSRSPALGSHGWQLEATLAGHTDGVLSLALSHSRRIIFSGSEDLTLRAWSLVHSAFLFEVNTFGSPVGAMTWHLASRHLVTGTEQDGIVQLWDVAPLEALLVSGSPDAASALQSSVQCVQTVTVAGVDDAPETITTLAPSADGTAVFCGLEDGSIVLLGPC